MNTICLVGRLTKDPTLEYPGEVGISKFAIAVGRAFKDKQTGEYPTDFFNIIAFGKTAEHVANTYGKGRQVEVVGRIECRKYEKDGQQRDWWEVKADSVRATGAAQPQGGGTSSGSSDGSDPFGDS
jgi:single-strand DNA-binding protein